MHLCDFDQWNVRRSDVCYSWWEALSIMFPSSCLSECGNCQDGDSFNWVSEWSSGAHHACWHVIWVRKRLSLSYPTCDLEVGCYLSISLPILTDTNSNLSSSMASKWLCGLYYKLVPSRRHKVELSCLTPPPPLLINDKNEEIEAQGHTTTQWVSKI